MPTRESSSQYVPYIASLQPCNSEHLLLSKSPSDGLRPGLYLLDSTDIEENLVYIIFWPEPGTWDVSSSTSSASRNRVTFMRSVRSDLPLT
jgi:hypothetical protein